MSWQLNSLIGPQIDNSIVSYAPNEPSSSTAATPAPTNTAVSSHPQKISDKDLLASTRPESTSASSATVENVNQSRENAKQEFFHRLLDQHRLDDTGSSKMDPRSSISQKVGSFSSNMNEGQSNSSISMQTTSDHAAPAGHLDSIFDHSAALINNLLPDQGTLPWSTFATMPHIYSPSFGLGATTTTTGADDGSFHGTDHLHQHQQSGGSPSSLLSPGVNLLNRFNQSFASDVANNTMFSLPTSSSGGSSIGAQRELYRRGDGAVGGGGGANVRSYSSVLHSQPEQPPMAGRYSIFGLREQQDNHQANLMSRQGSQQQQYPQQLRHIGEFSPQIDPSTYPMQQHHHLRQAPFSSLSGQSVGIINGNNNIRQNNVSGGTVGLSDRTTTTAMGNVSGGLTVNPTTTVTSSASSTSYSGAVNKRRNKLPFFSNSSLASSDGQQQHSLKVDLYGAPLVNSDGSERFSRKVFVGGLPPDIDEEEIKASFRRFGSLIVDWPHKAESKSYFPPKGYAFLLFHEESSVQALIDACLQEEDKLYLCVSSPTIKDKPVQIRPWRLSDADYVLDSTLALDPRKTVFVGGVPRPLKASELANIMNNLYGGVCYAGIDTDPELKYPKGAGRVAFSNHQSYIAAISARFVHLQHSEIEKRVEVKPYVLDDQFCDECQGARCANKFAPFFCANITCLQYYCENCWSTVHSQPGRAFHKPLVKEGADRPRGVPVRWC